MKNLNSVFWDIFDLPTNIERATKSVSGLSKSASIATAIVLGIMTYSLFFITLHFDILPTMIWVEVWLEEITTDMPSGLLAAAGGLGLALTFLPTGTQLTAGRFIKGGLAVFSILFVFFISFDLVTDWPNAKQFMSHYESAFLQYGAGGLVLFKVAQILKLILATIGYEASFLISFSAFTIVLKNLFVYKKDEKSKPQNNTSEPKTKSRNQIRPMPPKR